MKVLLRTYIDEDTHIDDIVDVDNDHDFTSSYSDTVPFTVGSNQVILSLDDPGVSHEDLIEAIRNL